MTFSKENARAVRTLLKPAEDAVKDFHGCYPTLSDRIFHHAEDGPTDAFNFWKIEGMAEYGKLRDDGDAII